MQKITHLTNPRLSAVAILQAVIRQKQSLDNALEKALNANLDNSFIKALCFGVIRYYYKLTALAHLLLSKPLKDKDHDIYLLLLSGIYELIFMRTPAHAVVSETVNATRTLGKTWASGLVNAVLRSFQRKQEALLEQLEPDFVAHYAHPAWFIETIKKA